ncbi:hypothetical protein D3C73_1482670 [compost metagenome]
MRKTGLILSPEGVTGVVGEQALFIKAESIDQEVGKGHRREVVGGVVLVADTDDLLAIVAEPGGVPLGLVVDDGEERRLRCLCHRADAQQDGQHG